MKRIKVLLTILISIIIFTGCGNKDPKYYMSVVIARQNNILYVHNLGGTRNDDKMWTQINLYDNVSQDVVKDTIKMEFKTGDMILFNVKGFGGWHDLKDFKIVSHDNPIPDSE